MKPGTRTADVRFIIRRFNPQRSKRPHWQEYPVKVHAGMTVLEALHHIREEQDATLVWRSSCRMGVCGSCGMVINGLPRLACSTQVLDVAGKTLRVEPLWNFDIVRDLVADEAPMFARHASVQPHLLRQDDSEAMTADAEYRQSPSQLVDYLQFSYCIKCGLCMAELFSKRLRLCRVKCKAY